ncbi:STAS domain-containing protein [uncultured Thiodictyon sp.]|uniref:STAS domain-containing protein n=1 Tax=uncultured Thiodictyon sp. TaxID=1846217 RepID=UPI0025FEE1AB|nr:STAS domain-containing protein [uncultured Thiodictyon sp.]
MRGPDNGGGARLIASGDGRARVEGALDFDTVPSLLKAGDLLLRGPGAFQIDLGGVAAANSAGLALVLEWLDIAHSRQLSLHFLNLPDSLRRIAAFSNLEALLPCDAGGESAST